MVFIDAEKKRATLVKRTSPRSLFHMAFSDLPCSHLGDMLPPGPSILNPENAPGQTIWKGEATVALYAAVVVCARAASVRYCTEYDTFTGAADAADRHPRYRWRDR